MAIWRSDISRLIPGDANADGQWDLSDAVYLLSYLFAGGKELPCLEAVDTNDGGRVDVADAVWLLLYLFASGPEPEPPFPAYGWDLTQDHLGCQNHGGCRK